MGHAIVSLLLLRTKQRHDFNRSSAPPLPAWGVWEKISSKLRCIISLTDLVVFGQSLTTPWHLVSTNEVHHIYRTYHFPMLCHHFLHTETRYYLLPSRAANGMSCQCPLLYVMAGLSRYCHVLPNYNCVLKHKCQKWREEGVLEAQEHTMGGLFWKKFYHYKIAYTLATYNN